MHRLIARLWHGIRGPWQWRMLWFAHAKFMIGVTGVVRDPGGRVLLLRHRLWPEGRQWGLPTGYARARETFQETVAREVREGTGLRAAVGDVVTQHLSRANRRTEPVRCWWPVTIPASCR